MSYKRLGDYIQPVNIRNKELEVTTLLGVSIRKVLMPSIANTIGTNMKTYKIIKQNQFAYGPVTSRNGDKISIALLEEHETAIVSQAYTVFEVIDEQEVRPEYLMMWFRRPEFDRFARFKSHGSAREVFDWEELCDTQLPIPTIEKQCQIVAEYNTVTNRINLNNKLNQKLEATAQALYKHWFVDFEFPAHLSGTLSGTEGYKSSGGEMVYNEEFEKEIPVGWDSLALEDISNVVDSMHKTPKYSTEGYPMVRVTDINPGFLNLSNTFLVDESVFIEFSRNHKSKIGDIVVSRVGATFGEFSYAYTSQKFCLGQNTAVIIPIEIDCAILFTALSSQNSRNQIEQKVVGSAYSTLSLRDIKELKFVFPNNKKHTIVENLVRKINVIFENQGFCCQELKTLSKMQNLLLAKMTLQETKTTIV